MLFEQTSRFERKGFSTETLCDCVTTGETEGRIRAHLNNTPETKKAKLG